MRTEMLLAAPLAASMKDETTVTREARSTDAMKLTLPLPLTITIVGAALAAAAGVWRIEGKVAQIETALGYEQKLDMERQETIKQRFEAMEAKIDAAGLRNANMALAQELQNQRGNR